MAEETVVETEEKVDQESTERPEPPKDENGNPIMPPHGPHGPHGPRPGSKPDEAETEDNSSDAGEAEV